MLSRSISSIRTRFGHILNRPRSLSVSDDSKTTPESNSITMSQSKPMILNWPKPSELLEQEVETLNGIQDGKIVILSDLAVFVANAMKRIEILQIIVEKYGNQWAGNATEVITKYTPDMMVDQSDLPSSDGPEHVVE